jgi:hypothetical protein
VFQKLVANKISMLTIRDSFALSVKCREKFHREKRSCGQILLPQQKISGKKNIIFYEQFHNI